MEHLERRVPIVPGPGVEVEVWRDLHMEWLTTHRREVLEHRGKWIVVHPDEGIVTSGDAVFVVKEAARLGKSDASMLWYVPENEGENEGWSADEGGPPPR